MNCPFLHEARVRFCHASSFKKMLLQTMPGAAELCSSSKYGDCCVYRGHAGAYSRPEGERCPYLHESMVQYCAAAGAARPVPWSESTLIRCGQSGYRFCDVYLTLAHPSPARAVDEEDGIELPRTLHYTPNHMWLDIAEDGTWRIGIDALLAWSLGHIDSLEYITGSGTVRPTAVLTSGGTELHVVFPCEMPVASCNSWLRADPSRIADAPYTAGWLFRGERAPEGITGLIDGAAARPWMQEEIRQVTAFAHESLPDITGGTMADGGIPERGFLSQLPRAARLQFTNRFFSPLRSR